MDTVPRFDRFLRNARRAPQLGRTRRLGFSLAEVIVAMLVVAVIASFVIPTVFSRGKAVRADAIVSELTNIESAIMLYRNDVGRYPRRIDYLNKFPTSAGSLPLKDACNVNLSAANQAKYRGPYISRPIVLLDELTAPYYVLATGDTVNTVLIAALFNGQNAINIRVFGPELDIATDIDTKIDGIAGASAGKLQYTDNGGAGANAGMEKLLTYTIPIKAGTC